MVFQATSSSPLILSPTTAASASLAPINYNPSVFEDDDKDYAQLNASQQRNSHHLKFLQEESRCLSGLHRRLALQSALRLLLQQAVIFSSKDPLDFILYQTAGVRITHFPTLWHYTSDARGPGDKCGTLQQIIQGRPPSHIMLLTADSCVKPPVPRQPWYGQAIAQCILSEYMLKSYPYDDLVIYEIGAGNGLLPATSSITSASISTDVHERMKYNIVEISPKLAQLQRTSWLQNTMASKLSTKHFDWQLEITQAASLSPGSHCEFRPMLLWVTFDGFQRHRTTRA